MLRLEFLQTLQQIKLEASGQLKRFLGQYIFNRAEKWTKPEVANELLTIDTLENFESSFKTKDTENQGDTKQKITDLIALAKISVHLKELETMTNSEEKLARTVAFFTQEMFSTALGLLSLNQLMQAFTTIPTTHLSSLGFPPEAFFALYQRFQQTGEHLAMVRQLPQPILQYVVKIDSVEKLADGLQEVDVHLDEQQNRFKLLCLLEFYIKNRMHPNQNTFTSSGLTGYVIAPVASLPVFSMFSSMLGYHDKESKVTSAKKFQSAIAEQSWTAMLVGAEEPMKHNKSKQFFDKVVALASHYEPEQNISYQDSVLGAHDSRTPSPSRG